jgi:GNAT superfamily N-acetyltransferase
MSHGYKILHESPDVSEFIRIRKAVGWDDTDIELVKQSLKNSLFNVSIHAGERLIGVGRVVGDGYMYFYVQDVVVEPSYQQLGIGALLMKEIELYLSINAKAGSTIGLFAAKGKERFYLKYGYQERSGDPLGKGMCKFV